VDLDATGVPAPRPAAPDPTPAPAAVTASGAPAPAPAPGVPPAPGAPPSSGDPADAAHERRPTALDPRQLGFTPRAQVAWLAPVQLARTAVRVMLAQLFGAYLDKRELQNALPATVHAEGDPDGELWLDFVADLGDGFDATYTVAHLLAQDAVEVDGVAYPRGRVLVMGGDQVYPTASGRDYEDRTKGPYKAAMPVPPPGVPEPALYALPGNHDWYDGLTAFLRLFARGGRARLGGRRTRQDRSYFAVQLPRGWWLFAFDTNLGSYVDVPQLDYFHQAAQRLRAGDRVILCTPSPGWVQSTERADAYDAVDYFVRTVITPTGATVPLMLSGDLHHYARYAAEGRQLIHWGGGGAYLYGTHTLPGTIDVPPPASVARKQTASRRYRLAATYPTAAGSRGYAAGVFTRLPLRNLGFAGLVGVLHTLFMLGVVDAAQRVPPAVARLVTIPTVLLALAVLAGTTFLAMSPPGSGRSPRKWLFGSGHGLAHLGLGIAGARAWDHLPFEHWPWPLSLVAAFLVYLPVAALVGTELVCLYLLVAGSFRVNTNELFAGQGIDDAKGFLRMHIGADGALTVVPLVVDRVARSWTARPDAAAHRPWFDPATPVRVRLAEPPVRID
jgi:hypothetical protein